MKSAAPALTCLNLSAPAHEAMPPDASGKPSPEPYSQSRSAAPGHVLQQKRLLNIKVLMLAGEPGFEPGLHGPEPCVLPLNYSPTDPKAFKRLELPIWDLHALRPR